MPEIMERAAHALRMADSCDFHDAENKDYPAMVRAVLQAIREPSVEMGVASFAATEKLDHDTVGLAEEYLTVWQAMIDAAISEK